jgi:hypothetical protein
VTKTFLAVASMYGRTIDLRGRRFGRLRVLCRVPGPDGVTKRSGVWWKCLCNCRKIHIVLSTSLTHRNVQSCGCLRRESSRERMMAANAARNGKK